MIYLLVAHIAGAVVSGGAVFWTWVNIIGNTPSHNSSKILQGLTIFEILSGTVLAILGNGSAIHACTNIGLYATVLAGTIAVAEYKTTKVFAWQPVVQNISLALGAMAFILGIK